MKGNKASVSASLKPFSRSQIPVMDETFAQGLVVKTSATSKPRWDYSNRGAPRGTWSPVSRWLTKAKGYPISTKTALQNLLTRCLAKID